MSKIRIAFIESPNPLDLFDGRSEAKALEICCNQMGHQVVSFFAKSRAEFKSIVHYLASADSIHAQKSGSLPLFLHLSSHGNDGIVAFGSDNVEWDGLVSDLMPLLNNSTYSGKLALSISSCGSGENSISRHAKNAFEANPQIKMPAYIFSILGETLYWDDALISWSLLYHKIAQVGIQKPDEIKKALTEIKDCVGIEFAYRRWIEGDNVYKRFPLQNNN